MTPPADHECGWRDEALRLRDEVERLQQELEALKRRVLGPKSERQKVPSIERELRKPPDPQETQRRRRERAASFEAKLVTEQIKVEVPAAQRRCPHCGRTDLRPVGSGKPTTVYEYVPGYFRRRVHLRETLACPCGGYIVNAPTPDKASERTRYGEGFIAHLITAKCADSIPLYRLEKQYRRIGIPIARSTMTDLFHRHAEILAPLSRRLLERIAASEVVQADETSIKVLSQKKRGFLWTFVAGDLVAYRCSPDRSGQTPKQILGGTKGTLVVDAYTGYNHVTKVDGRERAGCLAHARRKLFEALPGTPAAQRAIDLIRRVYVVEHYAKERGIARTPAHRKLRQRVSLRLMNKLKQWLEEQRGLHPPKSNTGRAIGYALNNWQELTRFLEDENIPPDNNRSEAALRVVALGRKNYLFVHDQRTGGNIAGLYSLIASCEASGVNPVDYLRDVLIRVHSHPATAIDELLPDRWKPAVA